VRSLVLAVAVSLAVVPAASASIAVRKPPQEAFCTDRIRVGVRHSGSGPRLFSISIYGRRGQRVVYRSGVARARWRIFFFRPINHPPVRTGYTTYRTVYRLAGQEPRTFRTRVLCGE